MKDLSFFSTKKIKKWCDIISLIALAIACAILIILTTRAFNSREEYIYFAINYSITILVVYVLTEIK